MRTSQPSPRLNPVFDTTSRVAGLLVIAAGAVALLGWAIDFLPLASVNPRWVPMNPLTAVCFILTAAALLLVGKEPKLRRRRWAGAAAAVCAGVVTALALVKMADFLPGGGAVHVDQILFAAKVTRTNPPNVMAPNTAVAFTFLGLALLLLDARNVQVRWTASALTLASAGVALLALTGYLYSVLALYQVEGYIPMAVNTAACFMLLCSAPSPPGPTESRWPPCSAPPPAAWWPAACCRRRCSSPSSSGCWR